MLGRRSSSHTQSRWEQWRPWAVTMHSRTTSTSKVFLFVALKIVRQGLLKALWVLSDKNCGFFVVGEQICRLDFELKTLKALLRVHLSPTVPRVVFHNKKSGSGSENAEGMLIPVLCSCCRQCVAIACVNSFSSLYAGIVVFSTLGFMAKQQGVTVAQVAESGQSRPSVRPSVCLSECLVQVCVLCVCVCASVSANACLSLSVCVCVWVFWISGLYQGFLIKCHGVCGFTRKRCRHKPWNAFTLDFSAICRGTSRRPADPV